MATMRKHVRELADYIRAGWDVTNIHVEQGGRTHAKLKFHRDDKEYSIVVGNPSDHRAIKNCHAHLRKVLGEPASPEPKRVRTMEDMMQEAVSGIVAEANHRAEERTSAPIEIKQNPEPTTKSWEVRVSAYKTSNGSSDRRVVWFLFPRDVFNSHRWKKMQIEKLDDEHWKLSPGGTHGFVEYENRARVTYMDNIEPFGSSIGEAVEDDAGGFLVYLAKQARVPVKPRPDIVPFRAITPPPFKAAVKATAATPPPKRTEEETPQAIPAPPTPATPAPPPSGIAGELRMRSILNNIREIEAMSPYRLTRLEDGRLLWRAPTIS